MAVKYKDYYAVLGVDRNATDKEIRASYRQLARKFHPDVNKSPDAEAKFKEVGEAYEVLRDAEKRKRYDMLGSNWRAGQEFRPPPGWENVHFEEFGEPSENQFGGSFSDFFESLFGSAFGPQQQQARGRRPAGFGRRGEDHEAVIRIGLEDAYHGATRSLSLTTGENGRFGASRPAMKNIEVHIPKGILPGQKIRLAGQGGPGHSGASPGDLYLVVQFEAHPHYRLDGRDVHYDLPLSPWEAALGAKVSVPTPPGNVTVSIPPGSSSGRKLRLRGKGFPNPNGPDGDMYVVVKIVVPKNLTESERALFNKLAAESRFNPRGNT